MDPQATLNIMLDRARAVLEWCDENEDASEGIEDDARELAEAVEALDAWISKGGFLPAAWDKARGK